MLRGLPASIILHGGIVAASVYAWPHIAPERELQKEFMIELSLDMELGTTTNIAPVVKTQPQPEPEETEPEIEPEPEEPEEEPEELEIGDSDMDTTREREFKTGTEEQAASSEAESAASTESEDAKQKPDPMDELLSGIDWDQKRKENSGNNISMDEKQKGTSPSWANDGPKDENPDEARRGIGDSSRETVRVQGMIASQMRVCWDDVVDLPNPERLNIIVRIQLNEDGSLNGDVEPVEPRRPPTGDRPMGVAYERALRAARKCAPYRLPKDAISSYEEWKDITFRIGQGFGQ